MHPTHSLKHTDALRESEARSLWSCDQNFVCSLCIFGFGVVQEYLYTQLYLGLFFYIFRV